MIEQIYSYFTIEMIYLWLNIGVLPFWFILIFFPQTNICRYIVASIIPFLILSSIYIYLIFIFYKSGYDFVNNFSLYIGLEQLSKLFEKEGFLILFWVHFISINLFCGSWIVKDSQKYSITKILISIPLLATYFVGPFGIFLYWFVRIFFSKKIGLYD